MRQQIIAGNWKMHTTKKEAIQLASAIVQHLRDYSFPDNLRIILCPPFPFLDSVYHIIEDTGLILGAQNMHPAESGAYTGEVSPLMLKSVHCRYVIIGHSERREYFCETDEFINKKIIAAIQHNLIPILCIGEKWEDRENHRTFEVLAYQLLAGLRNVEPGTSPQFVIAYEPVWAIGTGHSATPEQAQEAHQFIRSWLQEHFSATFAEEIAIIYGGSVNPENAPSLLQQPDIDGALIGGASLKADAFVNIVQSAIQMH